MRVRAPRWQRLATDQKGTAALEFALILPIMIALFMGIFEVSCAVSAGMRLNAAAQSMADMLAQQADISVSESANICAGAKMTMYPLAGSSLKIAVASVTKGAASVALDWTDNVCGNASAIASPTTLAPLLTPNVNDSVIIVRATFAYTSPISYVLAAAYTLTSTAFARPRNVSTVTHS